MKERNKMKYLGIVALVSAISFATAVHAQSNGSTTFTVTYPPSAVLVTVNPNPATPASCPLAAGIVLSSISATGGNGTPISVSLSDTTDFALSAATLPANIIVPAGGTPPADCGKSVMTTVSWSQNASGPGGVAPAIKK
jgi:hypothetical protein